MMVIKRDYICISIHNSMIKPGLNVSKIIPNHTEDNDRNKISDDEWSQESTPMKNQTFYIDLNIFCYRNHVPKYVSVKKPINDTGLNDEIKHTRFNINKTYKNTKQYPMKRYKYNKW